MSTRCYPLFVKGNPQLRVFLPNFWMKLVKSKEPMLPNSAKFIISREMTKFDVKNYLEKIYNIPVKEIRITNMMGEFRQAERGNYVVKDDNYKVAYIILPEECKFEFPNLHPDDKKEEDDKDLKMEASAAEAFKQRRENNWQRPGIPLWFGS